MGIRASQVSITSTPTRIDVVEDAYPNDVTANSYIHDRGQSIVVTTPSVIYVDGNAGVATSGVLRGFPLPAGTWTFDLNPDDSLYGVVASGTTVIETLQVGVRATGWGMEWDTSPWGE